MTKSNVLHTVPVVDAHARFGEMITQARASQEPIVVDQDGTPVIVILSFDEYQHLLKDSRLARFEQFSRAAGLEAEQQGLTEERLDQEMEAIKQQLYQERYG